jgi:NTE family protein
LYALGYSAHEIDSIIRRVDWDQVLSNSVPLNYIAFEEKEYYDRYLLGFPIQGYKVQIGSGLIRGQMLSEIMHYNLWPAVQYESFDDFPIPFRCLATNVGAGESVIFSGGSLPAALRASMAIPTAFTAIDRDSTLLVDGCVLNNFPAEVGLYYWR